MLHSLMSYVNDLEKDTGASKYNKFHHTSVHRKTPTSKQYKPPGIKKHKYEPYDNGMHKSSSYNAMSAPDREYHVLSSQKSSMAYNSANSKLLYQQKILIDNLERENTAGIERLRMCNMQIKRLSEELKLLTNTIYMLQKAKHEQEILCRNTINSENRVSAMKLKDLEFRLNSNNKVIISLKKQMLELSRCNARMCAEAKCKGDYILNLKKQLGNEVLNENRLKNACKMYMSQNMILKRDLYGYAMQNNCLKDSLKKCKEMSDKLLNNDVFQGNPCMGIGSYHKFHSVQTC